MDTAQNIQWYPGHMTKAIRDMEKSISIVDCVIELADARIPISSRNPDLTRLLRGKPRLLLLNKADLAETIQNDKWVRKLSHKEKTEVLAVSSKKINKGEIVSAVKRLLSDNSQKWKNKGMVGRKLRVMVVGIPNVGKSTLVNSLIKKSAAKAENRPGVTRGAQWFSLGEDIELMDTPGLLWPKLDNREVGEHLALIGSIREQIYDSELLALQLLNFLSQGYPDLLAGRYNLQLEEASTNMSLLRDIAEKRGFLSPGGEPDTERAASMLLSEFRNGRIGRITIERA